LPGADVAISVIVYLTAGDSAPSYAARAGAHARRRVEPVELQPVGRQSVGRRRQDRPPNAADALKPMSSSSMIKTFGPAGGRCS
jgi:hypothetical protein